MSQWQPEIGERGILTDFGGKQIPGRVDRYLEGDADGGGYWFVGDDGDEYDIYFHALFRGEQKLTHEE